MHAIEVSHLTKIYPPGIKAVDDISFTVEQGEIFGFLGPNGAGKSTTILMLTTLLRITSGTAWIQGQEVSQHPYQVRQSLGYVSQDLAVDDNLTGWENLFLQAKLYGLTKAQIAQRIPEVLRMVDLSDRAKDLVETYSGGMRKRLDIAEGLIHRPQILFLDEPTLGLDIQTRREIWKYIIHLREEVRMTIFLTTHYMDEADLLCDRIAIIDRGKIKAIDTPSSLKQALGGEVVTFTLTGKAPDRQKALAVISSLPGVQQVKTQAEQSIALVKNSESAMPAFFEAIRPLPVSFTAIALQRPSLDDVYLHFTGRGLRDEVASSKEEAMRHRLTMRRTRR